MEKLVGMPIVAFFVISVVVSTRIALYCDTKIKYCVLPIKYLLKYFKISVLTLSFLLNLIFYIFLSIEQIIIHCLWIGFVLLKIII